MQRTWITRAVWGLAGLICSWPLLGACGGSSSRNAIDAGASSSDASTDGEPAAPGDGAVDSTPLAGNDGSVSSSDDAIKLADSARADAATSDTAPLDGPSAIDGSLVDDAGLNLAPCLGCGLSREGVRSVRLLKFGTGPQQAAYDPSDALCETQSAPFGTIFVSGNLTTRRASFCYGGSTEDFNRSFVSIALEQSSPGAYLFRGRKEVKAAAFAFSRPYDNNPSSFFVDEAIVLIAVNAAGGLFGECRASSFVVDTVDASDATCQMGRMTLRLNDPVAPTQLQIEFANGGRDTVPLFDLTLP